MLLVTLLGSFAGLWTLPLLKRAFIPSDQRDSQRENEVYEPWLTLFLGKKIYGSEVAIPDFEVQSLKCPYIKQWFICSYWRG